MKKLKLVLVTKKRQPEEIQKILAKYNIKRIAENRLEEAEEKFPFLQKPRKTLHWQASNKKDKKICEFFDVIQTVENLDQAKKSTHLERKNNDSNKYCKSTAKKWCKLKKPTH